MNQEERKSHIVSIEDYKGTHLAKSYKGADEPKMSLIDGVNNIAKSCNAGFNEGRTSQEDLEKAFDQLEDKLTTALEKSESNMTFERTGELGAYSYELVEKSSDEEEESEEEEETEE